MRRVLRCAHDGENAYKQWSQRKLHTRQPTRDEAAYVQSNFSQWRGGKTHSKK